MQGSQVLSLSPSFNTYSSSRLTEIAARVVEEFRNESEFIDDDFYCPKQELPRNPENPQIDDDDDEKHGQEDEEEGEFEFSFVCREPEESPISADDVFYNGQIRPVYPIFNTDLLLADCDLLNETVLKPRATRRLSLGKLMTEERDTQSCSSSEADDLESVPPGTYCVWTPQKPDSTSPGRCKKSNSTGSSKRWKFRDLLNRSNSDGKDTFVFLTPSASASAKAKKNEEKSEKEISNGDTKIAGNLKTTKVAAVTGEIPPSSVHEAHYVRNRAIKEGDKRRSYLPYRQDLVGFFTNVNGLSRNLHPF